MRAVTPLEQAFANTRRGLRVFPCQWRGQRRKLPLTKHGFCDASIDPAVITAWWTIWPEALIGVPTGYDSGFVVLDVDVKRDEANGFDTLADLDCASLPDTPMTHTASGGLHLYFHPPADPEIRNTEGKKGRGIGPGLDWRGTGGYVIVPSPNSGYWWDPHWNLDTVALALVPSSLLPRQPEPRLEAQPIERTTGLSPYAEAALARACRAIGCAPAGEQEATLNRETFSIATLAGAGGIPSDFARRALHNAARNIRDYDPHRPWRAIELEQKVDRAFHAGLQRPRQPRHG